MIYNGKTYNGIEQLNLSELSHLPKTATTEHSQLPLLAMVQNEDQIDFWLVDPSDVVAHTETIREYYRIEESWVINHPSFLIRLFSLSQEIVS